MLEFASLLPDRGGPVFAAMPSAGYGALHAALQGILAALHMRRQTHRGTHVETSLLQGNSAYDMIRWYAMQAASADPLAADRLSSWGAIQHQIPRPNYLTAVTKDGVWLQFANTLPHLFMAQMNALGLTDLYSDPRYVDLPAIKDPEDSEGVWEAVLDRVREKTWAEWQPIFDAERDIAVEPFFEASDAFDHPQVLHNEHIIEIDGVRAGRPDRAADGDAGRSQPWRPAARLGQRRRLRELGRHRVRGARSRAARTPLRGSSSSTSRRSSRRRSGAPCSPTSVHA